jgi:hypothetical protein
MYGTQVVFEILVSALLSAGRTPTPSFRSHSPRNLTIAQAPAGAALKKKIDSSVAIVFYGGMPAGPRPRPLSICLIVFSKGFLKTFN